MKTSIIIVSYHTGPALDLCLHSVLRQEGLAEVILVDNGNPVGVVEKITHHDSRITLITGQGNVGFAKGCNLGAAKASGEYLLFLNPDCVLSEGALASFMSELSNWPRVGLMGALLVIAEVKEQA